MPPRHNLLSAFTFGLISVIHVAASGHTDALASTATMAFLWAILAARYIPAWPVYKPHRFFITFGTCVLSIFITALTGSPLIACFALPISWLVWWSGRQTASDNKAYAYAFAPALAVTQPWAEAVPALSLWFRTTGTELTGLFYKALGIKLSIKTLGYGLIINP